MSVIQFPTDPRPVWMVVAQRIENSTQAMFLAGPITGPVLEVTTDESLAYRWPTITRAREQAERMEATLGGFWLASPVPS